MKALVKKYREKGIWLDRVPKPQLTDTDVLIKIWKTAICGTDVHIYIWNEWAQKTISMPLVIGHEFVGEIVELGRAVDIRGLRVGALVSGEGHITCGICRNCLAGDRHLCIHTVGVGVQRQGCFAEYLAIPASNVFLIPEGISDEEATILDPLGNAVHTALSFSLVGEDVLITGAGPIGIFAALVAQHVGARNTVITEVNDYRLELARKVGVQHVVDARKQGLKDVMTDLGMKEGFDVGLEMSGSPDALREMIKYVRNGAKIALLGFLPSDTYVSWNEIILKGLILKGIYGREIFETWYKMCAMLQSGLNVKPVITHRFPLDRYEEAFEVMASGESGKVLLNWRANP